MKWPPKKQTKKLARKVVPLKNATVLRNAQAVRVNAAAPRVAALRVVALRVVALRVVAPRVVASRVVVPRVVVHQIDAAPALPY
jgi:hypothetical protein